MHFFERSIYKESIDISKGRYHRKLIKKSLAANTHKFKTFKIFLNKIYSLLRTKNNYELKENYDIQNSAYKELLNADFSLSEILKLEMNYQILINPFLDGKNKIWPSGSDNLKKLSTFYFNRNKKLSISKETVISTLGNCNAFKFAHLLQGNGYNFPVYEENLDPECQLHDGSTKIGALFNCGALLQAIKWAFKLDDVPKIYYRDGVNGEIILTPFREEITFTELDIQRFNEIWDEHISNTKKLFLNVETLLIFIDTTESLKFLPTNHYYHRFPMSSELAYAKFHNISLSENIELLSTCMEILSKFNPNIQVIFAVSPSPPMYTHQINNNVICATALNKSTIRVAIENVCMKFDNASYFPFYEMVMYPGQDFVWEDSRHLNESIFLKGFAKFEKQYCVK